MMTLDDIRGVQFSKGRGYRAEEVDDFIDECVATVENLTREIEVANQKMKALADQVAQYRNDEDSIRAALLSAQRTGDTILRESEAKAKAMLDEANANAAALRRELAEQAEVEKQELARAKEETAAFKTKLLAMYKEHLASIGLLPEETEKPIADDTVADFPKAVPVAEPQDDTVIVDPLTEESARVETDEEMKPMSRFADLKFGNDYDIREDDEDDEEDDEPSRGLFWKKK